jgi:hypothetical protein
MKRRSEGLAALGVLRRTALVGLPGILLCAQPASAQTKAPYKDLASYVTWVQSMHKAPFDRDGSAFPEGGAKKLMEEQARARATKLNRPAAQAAFHNIKVNQDRNAWPKAELAAAIDPTNGANYVVMENDFRENYDHMFYHVSTDHGKTWTDDSMVWGSDPITGFIPLNFQSDPGVSFDDTGHSYLSTITGNLIFDFTNFYINQDTEIDVAQGFAHGAYTSLLPIPIDDQPCYQTLSTFQCDAALDKPLITTDAVPGSPNNGTTYVYYTLFCNSPVSGFCNDGNATNIPAFSSVILESHSPGAGFAFSAPSLVSGPLTQEQFSSMVIDSHGTPHMFFDDFSGSQIQMWESTLSGGVWTVSAAPVATFTFNGLNNFLNWSFRDNGAEAPGCGIHGDTAYCAFSANQIGAGRIESTPSVYLAVVDTLTGTSTINRVNNDPFGDTKDHFFAWATATPNGNVYVGWYDNRNDPFNATVDYFVGLSTDGGATFPMQKAVNDVPFNPCIGFPGCGFFGDYTQLVSGPDGVVHAAWSDTRDGASMQVWSQRLIW